MKRIRKFRRKKMDERVAITHRRPVQAFVTRAFRRNAEDVVKTEQETLAVHCFVTEPAKVSVSFGLTLNLGNYESARIEIGLTCPCYSEEKNETYEYAQKWVEDRINKEAQEIRRTSTSF